MGGILLNAFKIQITINTCYPLILIASGQKAADDTAAAAADLYINFPYLSFFFLFP